MILENCVATNGCFDVFHFGHLYLLNYAKQIADDLDVPLVIAINSDCSVKLNKGDSRPIFNLNARMSVLEALKLGIIIPFDDKTPYELFLRIKPSVIIKGSDYTVNQVIGYDLAKVIICPRLEGFSSSGIIDLYSNSK